MTQPNTSDILINLDGYNYSAADKALLKRLLPYDWVAVIVDLGLFAALYVAAVWLFQNYGLDAIYIIVALIILRQLFVLALKIHRKRVLSAARRNAPCRLGPRTFSMSQEGFRIGHPGFSLSMRWSHVLDVIKSRDGLLIVLGGMDALEIPADALPAGYSIETLKAEITRHIEAGRQM